MLSPKYSEQLTSDRALFTTTIDSEFPFRSSDQAEDGRGWERILVRLDEMEQAITQSIRMVPLCYRRAYPDTTRPGKEWTLKHKK